MPEVLEEQRESWGTRSAFVLAAIGSAVGLGNLWGFPYKAYANGGGAFLIPYVIAMVLIGVPVLILEFALGHMTQRAAPDAFRGVNRRSEPIGWWGILLGFVIITYYCVVLAWCLDFFVVSLKGILTGGELPWAGRDAQGVARAQSYFSAEYLNDWPSGTVKTWALGAVVPRIVWSLLAVWLMVYLCIFRGLRLVGRVVLWTVPLPWLMLTILTIRALTLEGAAAGLEYYLKPNWTELAKPSTWRWAFGQMFFSLSLAFGVMVTYASFLHRKSDLNNNAALIALGDLGTSFVAGLAVFATLGAMALVTGQADVSAVVDAGPDLTFKTLPYALAQFPYSAWFSAVFFFALITLGIDSAFSIAESVLAALVDKTGWNRSLTLVGLVLLGAASGVVYCTRGGKAWLFGMDDFINGPWGIALLGMLQCLVLGWMYRVSRLRRHANERSDWKLGAWWDWLIRVVAPVILAALFIWSLLEQVTSPTFLRVGGHLVWPNVTGLVLAGLAPVLAVVLSLIHSPGADTHAGPVDGPIGGRAAGRAGAVLAAAGLACVCLGFLYACRAKLGYGEPGLSAEGWRALRVSGTVLACGMAAAAAGLVLGAAAVVRAEGKSHRPSRWARAAGSASSLAAGCCGGLLLALWIMARRLDKAPRTMTYDSTLSGGSYAVLAAMFALILGGLSWCFYRALKAAGGAESEQRPEG